MKKLLLLLAVLISPCVESAEYFVSPTGSTTNNGLSTSATWPLQHALTQIVPGITITVLPGLYAGVYTIDSLSGAPGNPATVRSQLKWQAVLSNATNGQFTVYGTNLVLDSLCISNAFYDGIGMVGVSNTIRNCWIVHSAHHAIDASNPANSNNIVEECLLELSGHGDLANTNGWLPYGIYLSGPNNVIRNNVFRHNGGAGIHFSTSYDNVKMRNNLFYNNLTYGHTNLYGLIVQGIDNTGVLGTNYVFGNTILDGVSVLGGTVYITNNIIRASVANPTINIAVYVPNAPAITNNYNLSTISFYNEDGVTAGANDVITNYLGFVNTNSGLYWLKSDSPARGTAKTTVFGPVDFFGNAQSSVSDIGAFQYTAALAGDVRVLDPSPVVGADYWLQLQVELGVDSGSVGSLYIR